MSEYGFFIGTAVFVLIVEFVAILKSNHDEEEVYRRGFEDGKNHFNCQDVKPIILDTLNGDIEKPVISKKDRAFLEYLGKELKYIVRSESNNLMAFQNSAEKREDGWVIGFGALKSLQKLNIDLPMVKWSDEEPWLIEDLKKLEVVDEYE